MQRCVGCRASPHSVRFMPNSVSHTHAITATDCLSACGENTVCIFDFAENTTVTCACMDGYESLDGNGTDCTLGMLPKCMHSHTCSTFLLAAQRGPQPAPQTRRRPVRPQQSLLKQALEEVSLLCLSSLSSSITQTSAASRLRFV